MAASPVIEVRNLSKQFDGLTALDQLSFQVDRGEILGLLGPNGAGKTTTIHMLLGLVSPSAGQIKILGLDGATHRREILKRVNFSSAYTSLPTNLTVLENLTFFAMLYGIARSRPLIEKLLKTFEIEKTLHQRTGGLSSGQLTRLNLCKAFLNEPQILFLDEPTASLDPDIAAKVRDRLHELQRQRGVSMIYTSHNMDEVEMMCDRVIFISHGRLIMEGPPREITRQANHANLEELFIAIARDGSVRDIAAREEEDGCISE